MEPIKIRPHHGLCILNFTGHGYSESFTVKMTALKQELSEHPDTLIRITKGCDTLCKACPHKITDACDSGNPSLFDENVLHETGFQYEEILPWSDFICKTSPLSLYHLDTVCKGCEWMELCKEIAKNRIRTDDASIEGIQV